MLKESIRDYLLISSLNKLQQLNNKSHFAMALFFALNPRKKIIFNAN